VLQTDLLQERRNDFDVTNTVRVSSPAAVRSAVRDLFRDVYPLAAFDPVWMAFHDFERCFEGQNPSYHAVDTSYHDIQHTLDMTLALMRLVAGYESTAEARDRLGPERCSLGLITALFHDAGYLRHRLTDQGAVNGAEFTLTHVSRSAAFLACYLPRVGMAHLVAVATQIVHFTGYEMSLDDIELDDPRDSMIGHLLGTADLIAQLADRCYLEKCRDRLYPEFVLGGIAVANSAQGALIRYRSGHDLLSKTLSFYQSSARHRLERAFNRAYRYVEPCFDGENPYVLFIRRNLGYLTEVLERHAWNQLRRHPPCCVPDPQGEGRVMALAMRRLQQLAQAEKIALQSGASVRLKNPAEASRIRDRGAASFKLPFQAS
jgi:hypothetical protein